MLACLTFVGCDQGDSAAVGRVAAAETLETAQRYLDAHQFEQAEAVAIAAHRDAPDDPDVIELLARADFGKGMSLRTEGLIDASNQALEAALEHWWDACALRPDAGPMHVSAGDVASMLGRGQTARHFYERAVEIDGAKGRAGLCLAQLLLDEAPDRAEDLLRQVSVGGVVPEAHATLGLLLARTGDSAEARTQIDRAVQLTPGGVSVRVMQARVERLLDDPGRGVEVLTALPLDSQGDESVAFELAQCWAAIGRPKRAAETWVTCFHLNAHRSDAWRLAQRAADAWRAAGDPDGAAVWDRQARLLGAAGSSGGSSP